MPTLVERIEGGILGLLIGDALGVPYEFKTPEELPELDPLELAPPAGFQRAWPDVKPGTYSDDGAQALCLLESLLLSGRMDVDDFARRMVNWLDWGHLAVDDHTFDVGNQTRHALDSIRRGVAPLQASRRDDKANGNGSLMRVLPLALWHTGSDEELVHDACLSSRVTHAHMRSQLSCALYCLVARRLLAGEAQPWGPALVALRTIFADDPVASAELDQHVRPELPPAQPGGGYVIDSLRAAHMLLAHESYEDVVRGAIALGTDTDTTAAIAGGLAGLRGGVTSIPVRWRIGLRGRELFDPLLRALLQRRAVG